MLAGTQALIDRQGLGEVLTLSGHPAWSFLAIKDRPQADAFTLKTLFMQEVLARGVLAYGTHNMSYAHGDAEVAALLAAYDATFAVMAEALSDGDVLARLRCEPLKPLFKVR